MVAGGGGVLPHLQSNQVIPLPTLRPHEECEHSSQELDSKWGASHGSSKLCTSITGQM